MVVVVVQSKQLQRAGVCVCPQETYLTRHMTKHQQDAGGTLNGLGPKPLSRPAIKQEPLESGDRDSFLPSAHAHDKSPIDLGANPAPPLPGDSSVGGLGGELVGWGAGGGGEVGRGMHRGAGVGRLVACARSMIEILRSRGRLPQELVVVFVMCD